MDVFIPGDEGHVLHEVSDARTGRGHGSTGASHHSAVGFDETLFSQNRLSIVSPIVFGMSADIWCKCGVCKRILHAKRGALALRWVVPWEGS